MGVEQYSNGYMSAVEIARQLVSDIEGSFGRASKLLVPAMGILARSV